MANIDNGFRIELLSLDDKTLLATGESQPDGGAGYEAPQGSLYLRQNAGTDGEVYVKFGPSDTDWETLTETIKNNYTAVVGPTVTDDSSAGYSVGSHWIDTAADFTFVCVDSTLGAAIWLNVTTGRYLNQTGITGQNSGLVTINGGDPSLIDITETTYFIQGIFYIFPAQVGVDPELEPLEDAIFIGLTSTGIVRKTGKWSAIETRTIIPLVRLNTEIGQPKGPGANIHLIRDDRYFIDEVGYRDRLWHERVVGALYQEGGVISENTITGLTLDQSAGVLFDAQKKEQLLSSQTQISGIRIYNSAGSIAADKETPLIASSTLYNDGSNLVAIPSNKWVNHTLLKSPKGSPQEGEFFFIFSTSVYNTLVEAQLADPDYGFFIDQATSGMVAVAQIMVNEGDANITEINDLRPVLGLAAGGSAASATTMQSSYDISTAPQYSLTSTRGGIEVRDSVIPIGVDLFSVTDSTGAIPYLNVDVNGVDITDLVITGSTSGIDHTELSNIGTNTHVQIDTHITDTNNPHAVTSTQVGLGDVQNIKDNFAAAVAPTVTDDSGSGYSIGSEWIDTVTDKHYICTDASLGAAIWVETTASGAASDHGALTGLADDDHTQYHTDARGDLRYYTQTQLDAGQLDTQYYTETEIDTLFSGWQIEINAVETSGGYLNTDGTFDPTLLNTFINITGLTGANTLVDALSQMDSAITGGSSGGKLFQVSSGTIPAVSGTASIIITNLLPLVTEGVQLWTDSITLIAATSLVRIQTSVVFSGSTSSMEMVWVLFRDTTPIASSIDTLSNKESADTFTISFNDTPGTVGPHTYSLRIGKNNGLGTWYVNSHPLFTTPLGNLLENNGYTIEEIGV